MIWSGVFQMMVVGMVCSRHGNTLDASMGSLLPSHNCEDDDNDTSRGRRGRSRWSYSLISWVMRKEKSSLISTASACIYSGNLSEHTGTKGCSDN